MISGIPRLALSLGLTLALGFAFVPLGCGSSGEAFTPLLPTHGDLGVPEGIARQITACAREHQAHLESAQHSVSFEVKLARDGQVDSVALRDSTLGDQELEACMASALRSLSADALPMRHSHIRPQGPIAPESHALLGQA